MRFLPVFAFGQGGPYRPGFYVASTAVALSLKGQEAFKSNLNDETGGMPRKERPLRLVSATPSMFFVVTAEPCITRGLKCRRLVFTAPEDAAWEACQLQAAGHQRVDVTGFTD